MSGVPLNAMCSIMWGSPVLLRGSCAEPASTSVKKENTGASGRRHKTTVSPLGRVFTETRFSYDERSCAPASPKAGLAGGPGSCAASGKAAASRSRQVNLANQRFIGFVPPKPDLSCIRFESYAGTDVQVKWMKARRSPRRGGFVQKHENPAIGPGS